MCAKQRHHPRVNKVRCRTTSTVCLRRRAAVVLARPDVLDGQSRDVESRERLMSALSAIPGKRRTRRGRNFYNCFRVPGGARISDGLKSAGYSSAPRRARRGCLRAPARDGRTEAGDEEVCAVVEGAVGKVMPPPILSGRLLALRVTVRGLKRRMREFVAVLRSWFG